MVRRFVHFEVLCTAKYRFFASTPKFTKRRTIYFLYFKIESKHFEILNPSWDDYKVPSYKVKLSKRHFIS
jgi:hypothetical protein